MKKKSKNELKNLAATNIKLREKVWSDYSEYQRQLNEQVKEVTQISDMIIQSRNRHQENTKLMLEEIERLNKKLAGIHIRNEPYDYSNRPTKPKLKTPRYDFSSLDLETEAVNQRAYELLKSATSPTRLMRMYRDPPYRPHTVQYAYAEPPQIKNYKPYKGIYNEFNYEEFSQTDSERARSFVSNENKSHDNSNLSSPKKKISRLTTGGTTTYIVNRNKDYSDDYHYYSSTEEEVLPQKIDIKNKKSAKNDYNYNRKPKKALTIEEGSSFQSADDHHSHRSHHSRSHSRHSHIFSDEEVLGPTRSRSRSNSRSHSISIGSEALAEDLKAEESSDIPVRSRSSSKGRSKDSFEGSIPFLDNPEPSGEFAPPEHISGSRSSANVSEDEVKSRSRMSSAHISGSEVKSHSKIYSTSVSEDEVKSRSRMSSAHISGSEVKSHSKIYSASVSEDEVKSRSRISSANISADDIKSRSKGSSAYTSGDGEKNRSRGSSANISEGELKSHSTISSANVSGDEVKSKSRGSSAIASEGEMKSKSFSNISGDEMKSRSRISSANVSGEEAKPKSRTTSEVDAKSASGDGFCIPSITSGSFVSGEGVPKPRSASASVSQDEHEQELKAGGSSANISGIESLRKSRPGSEKEFVTRSVSADGFNTKYKSGSSAHVSEDGITTKSKSNNPSAHASEEAKSANTSRSASANASEDESKSKSKLSEHLSSAKASANVSSNASEGIVVKSKSGSSAHVSEGPQNESTPKSADQSGSGTNSKTNSRDGFESVSFSESEQFSLPQPPSSDRPNRSSSQSEIQKTSRSSDAGASSSFVAEEGAKIPPIKPMPKLITRSDESSEFASDEDNKRRSAESSSIILESEGSPQIGRTSGDDPSLTGTEELLTTDKVPQNVVSTPVQEMRQKMQMKQNSPSVSKQKSESSDEENIPISRMSSGPKIDFTGMQTANSESDEAENLPLGFTVLGGSKPVFPAKPIPTAQRINPYQLDSMSNSQPLFNNSTPIEDEGPPTSPLNPLRASLPMGALSPISEESTQSASTSEHSSEGIPLSMTKTKNFMLGGFARPEDLPKTPEATPIAEDEDEHIEITNGTFGVPLTKSDFYDISSSRTPSRNISLAESINRTPMFKTPLSNFIMETPNSSNQKFSETPSFMNSSGSIGRTTDESFTIVNASGTYGGTPMKIQSFNDQTNSTIGNQTLEKSPEPLSLKGIQQDLFEDSKSSDGSIALE